jgi:molybdopterin synthase catalytic subunit
MSTLSNIKVSVQTEDFDLNKELSEMPDNSSTGAIVSFIGKVRDLDNNTLSKMTLEHYPGMTERSLLSITEDACKKWDLHDIVIIHRIGSLLVGDNIVLVIINSRHRKNAFNACEFIMDYLKTSAPFWKKEETPTSNSWVTSNQKDYNALSKWK